MKTVLERARRSENANGDRKQIIGVAWRGLAFVFEVSLGKVSPLLNIMQAVKEKKKKNWLEDVHDFAGSPTLRPVCIMLPCQEQDKQSPRWREKSKGDLRKERIMKSKKE